MANASIGGLSSGLDTAGIIDALMSLEAASQKRLQSRVTDERSVITKLQGINTRASLVASRAETLGKPATWTALTATSTASAVSVTAGAAAVPGRLQVTVTATATTHQLGFTDAHALTDTVVSPGTVVRVVRPGQDPLEIDTGDGTLAGLVAAINDPANETGLRAQTVRVGPDQYRLLVESVETGAAQTFDLTASDGQPLLGGATVRAGADATIDLGAGLVVSSSSNTFTDLLPGVTLTVAAGTAPGTTTDVTIERNAPAVTAGVKSLVDAVNDLLSEISAQTAYDAAGKRSGALTGDAAVRELRSRILDSVYPTDGTSLADVGIELDRNGRLTFDEERFAAAYAADPAGVEARFVGADGFAQRMESVATAASDPIDGTISQAIAGRNRGIERLEQGIEDWDRRLELRRTSLERQYAALEVALSQLSSQGSWLSSQLAAFTSSTQ